MTMGSPRRFFSASRGRVMGSGASSPFGTGTRGVADIAIPPVSVGWRPLREEGRHLLVDGDDLVVRVDVDDARLVVLEVLRVVGPVGDEDHGVAPVHEPRG